MGRARFERATIALKEQYLFYITLYINNLTFLFPLATLIESIDNLIQTAKIPLLFLRGKKSHYNLINHRFWLCFLKKEA